MVSIVGVGEERLLLDVQGCHVGGNLLHLEGRPGLLPHYSLGMRLRGFPLTSALGYTLLCILSFDTRFFSVEVSR